MMPAVARYTLLLPCVTHFLLEQAAMAKEGAAAERLLQTGTSIYA